MQDMTQGPVILHILRLSGSLAIGMIAGMFYWLVNLYFLAQMGAVALAGAGTAGALMLAVFSFAQVLGVGTVAAISHAKGQADSTEANQLLHDSLVLAAVSGLLTLTCGYVLADPYAQLMGADATTAAAAASYIHWLLPGLALQFPLSTMGSALRAVGVARPVAAAQTISVVLTAMLTPILIEGWGTNLPMGVAGAGFAVSLAQAIATVLTARYLLPRAGLFSLGTWHWKPRWSSWRRFLTVGLPAGGELLVSFIVTSVTYYCVRDLGSAAQAGVGAGTRVMQVIFTPSLAIGLAAGPVAGQNFGAGNGQRVRETFRDAGLLSCAAMAAVVPIIWWQPQWFINLLINDSDVRSVTVGFLQVTSWAYVAQALTYTCSSLFQGIGHTTPALFVAASRLITFVVPGLWVSSMSGFRMEQLWYLSIASILIEAGFAYTLLSIDLRTRLGTVPPTTHAA